MLLDKMPDGYEFNSIYFNNFQNVEQVIFVILLFSRMEGGELFNRIQEKKTFTEKGEL